MNAPGMLVNGLWTRSTKTRSRKVAHQRNWRDSTCSALVRWFRLGIDALRGMSRLLQLGPILVIALADAAHVRLTTPPSAPALSRSRAAWLHRWSRVVCCILGLRVERHGFVPASGLVIVRYTSLVDALVLSAIAPFVLVMGIEVRRRPFIGWLARFAGTRFHDDQMPHDVERIRFMIERALQRRQVVAILHRKDPLREPESLPELFLPTADAQCSLTAGAVWYQAIKRRGRAPIHDVAAGVLMRPRLAAAVAFHPPSLHLGDSKRLARQLWDEARTLGQLADGMPCLHRDDASLGTVLPINALTAERLQKHDELT
jgi:hypothetical protein